MITIFPIFWVFVVSSSNDAKVLLKQMTKFLGDSKYKVSLKKTLGGWKNLMKIDKCSFMWILVSPYFGAIFWSISSFGLLLTYYCNILGWVSESYSDLLKPCCNFIFQVSIIFGHF